MVAPVTSGHVKVRADSALWEEKIYYSRQAKPYNIQLPLKHVTYFWNPQSSYGNIWDIKNIAEDSYTWKVSDEAYAKAYARLVGKLGDGASIGIDLAQYKQANSMISARATQLLGFASSLVRGSPLGAARSLGISIQDAKRVMRTRHGVSRSLADLWLEFWFGWKPLVQDIYGACEVLSNPLPPWRIKGSATETRSFSYGGTAPATGGVRRTQMSRVSVSLDIEVVHPTLRKLQMLGLINPFSVAFDAIPWSFVLGWFSNINSYLSSFTDWAGLKSTDGYITRKNLTTVELFWKPCTKEQDPNCNPDFYLGLKGDGLAYIKYREPASVQSLPYPPLVFYSKELKLTRAMTAISLLVQKLPRH